MSLVVYCCFKPIVIYKIWSIIVAVFKAKSIFLCQPLYVIWDVRHTAWVIFSLAQPSVYIFPHPLLEFMLWKDTYFEANHFLCMLKTKLNWRLRRKGTAESNLNPRIHLKERTMYTSIGDKPYWAYQKDSPWMPQFACGLKIKKQCCFLPLSNPSNVQL